MKSPMQGVIEELEARLTALRGLKLPEAVDEAELMYLQAVDERDTLIHKLETAELMVDATFIQFVMFRKAELEIKRAAKDATKKEI